MKEFKNFVSIFDLKTAVILGLSLLFTYLCLHLGITIEMPTGIIGIAIVFPIVFSINAAYRRREEALLHLANFKSSAAGLYYGHRDWVSRNNEIHASRIRGLISELLKAVHKDLTNGDRNKGQYEYKAVYTHFSNISKSIEILREGDISLPGEISRLNQYLRFLVTEFEAMRNIYQYRTPISLRAYTHVFLNTFPLIYSPYFAFLEKESFTLGFMVAALYSVVLVGLDNIQESLEDPYDGIGMDDINLDIAENFVEFLEQE